MENFSKENKTKTETEEFFLELKQKLMQYEADEDESPLEKQINAEYRLEQN